MSQTALAGPRVARFTVGQVHTMLDAGILDGANLELIDGLLVHKDRASGGQNPMTIGEKHNLVIKLLARLDPELSKYGAHMQTQGPVRLSEHDEPEPDGAVLLGEPRDYGERIPTAADATCLIEVADSSLEYDRTTKALLYARSGIAQYLIVNLRGPNIEVYEHPRQGRFGPLRVVSHDETIDVHVGSSRVIAVPARDLLP
jgi:hypothetical protein